MFCRSWILSAVKIFIPLRPREIVTYHCCSFVAALDGGIREQDVIHGFALSSVGCDRIAAHELPVIFGQHPAIIQGDASVLMKFLHRHQFTIGKSASVLALGIGLELQSVAV